MIPVLAISAWSGTGKTSLLKKLIPALCAKGIRPGLIKHTHHNMDVDKPGKDSYELRKAGAAQTMVASNQRWALMTETPDEAPLISLILSAGWITPRWIWCWLRGLSMRLLRRSCYSEAMPDMT